MHRRLIEMARDPKLIPGVYNYCDSWCAYCQVTDRCLLFRRYGGEADRSTSLAQAIGNSLTEAIVLARHSAIEAGVTPSELDAAIALGPLDEPTLSPADLAIDSLGREYALHAARFLSSIVWMSPAGSGLSPAPLDVVAWYHLLIAAKTNRALLSAADAEGDEADAADDANGSAKIALIGIDRSRKALHKLRGVGHEATRAHLQALLDQLAGALERRLPDARRFVRPGLDEAAS
jgi:hypothetical protein